MDRRELITGLAAATSIAAFSQTNIPRVPNTYLELRVWRLHTSREDQATRLADYLKGGFAPALESSGAALIGAFENLLGPDGPYYVSLGQFPSLSSFQQCTEHLASDKNHQSALKKLSADSQFPFVRVESSLLRSFDVLPSAAIPPSNEKRPARIFELRTYESPSYLTLARKVGMFNDGEAKIFERLQMRPVFFGETIAGPRQPNLTYMLSFDDLVSRDERWRAFVGDPEWKSLSATPGLGDSDIVSNISNVILRPLKFSQIR